MENIRFLPEEERVLVPPSLCLQETMDRAVKTLKNCLMPPCAGLVRPFFAPGGQYGAMWWSLDYALAMEGAKWLGGPYVSDYVENLRAMQRPDGRIPLWGNDAVPHWPNVREPVGSLPKFMESAYAVAAVSPDPTVKADVLEILEKNLAWWFGARQDAATGLISAVFEETFVPNTVSSSGVYAPMDTNIEIALGCRNAAALARALGDGEKAARYEEKADALLSSVARYLWCEEDGFYYPYILTEKRHYKIAAASGFLGLYIPLPERKEKLLAALTDDARFNWATRPITTVAKDDPLFTVRHGVYNGNPAWLGSVWTLTNDAVIRALRFAGEDALATELARKTVACFADNYAEFVDPFTREGNGVADYGWTAAQFIRIVVEELGGVAYRAPV